MKKFFAMVLAMLMVLSMGAAFALEANTPVASEEEFAELEELIDYLPNEDYDKYTVVYFFLEDISADMYTMISAKEDDSEFYMEVFWFGVDDLAVATYDGENFDVTTDQSGFMTDLVPNIMALAFEQDMWKPIGEEA